MLETGKILVQEGVADRVHACWVGEYFKITWLADYMVPHIYENNCNITYDDMFDFLLRLHVLLPTAI